MNSYWLGIAMLSAIAVGILIVPWLLKRNRHQQDVLTNTQIIKQRMQELNREVDEGLISTDDKDIAVKELKLALVDETVSGSDAKQAGSWPLFIGIVISVILCGTLYYKSNEVGDLQHWQDVKQQSSELAKRIVIEADPNVTVDDLNDFSLAMRSKLVSAPDDYIGWLLLGRLHASLNRIESALQAFEKAYLLAPQHNGVLSSYTQTLVMTGDENYIRKAQGLLKTMVINNPQDMNAIGMLAVASSQLGDTQQALESWQQLKLILPADDPMTAEVDRRIAQLSAQSMDELAETQVDTTGAATSVLITVSIADELVAKIPENAFIFVFAQDANGSVRMPAAVVKNRLSALPIQVELSDANAMMPSFKLSQLESARLVARISLDENVAQAKGELQGEVTIPLQAGEKMTQSIVIDKELM
ncbi:c-type cytochrome biogenesis protein CcmI [Aliiglaciecola sp. 2_MG-2023]|uniref:c-type cytochrome biogenesis protein CcmI n=1 Tax=unclassified Aliiglaciecola TaxID=2593648 RepID=UPI0026E1C809|nr:MULTISPECIES: c-type cytochrome biogenesis protein CcmI [unclassified Aliiglaciecola]MDO6710127.1 c-type cytochrome biogenesis protein CcmI [Aliiglaciecola sp. 2_MG-2023]MDO6751275.1 c-type cytochrome biogenesis protein CcmI [Aliiglaciecola sp. 1_MG-2023]